MSTSCRNCIKIVGASDDLYPYSLVGSSSTAPSFIMGQLVPYTSGTPKNPPNISLPAFAYDPNGLLPARGWNVATQAWDVGAAGLPTFDPYSRPVFVQLVAYTGGTPANPPDVTQPAFAYDPNGVLPSKGWNVSLQQWK